MENIGIIFQMIIIDEIFLEIHIIYKIYIFDQKI